MFKENKFVYWRLILSEGNRDEYASIYSLTSAARGYGIFIQQQRLLIWWLIFEKLRDVTINLQFWMSRRFFKINCTWGCDLSTRWMTISLFVLFNTFLVDAKSCINFDKMYLSYNPYSNKFISKWYWLIYHLDIIVVDLQNIWQFHI